MPSQEAIQLATRMAKLQGEGALEVFAKAKALEAEGRDIIHLEIGEPDFDTAPHVVDAAIKALHAGHTHYAQVPGIPELRSAIAENVSHTRGFEVNANRVVVTPGSKPIALFTILALVEAGDQVMTFDPAFPIFESLIDFVGATSVALPLHEERGFRPEMEEILRRVSPKTKLIILNSPQNPTGGVLAPEDLAQIARVAEEHGCVVLSDEIYSGLQYEGEFTSIASLPGMQDRTVILDGFSKRYAMTGWRLGFGVLPAFLVEPVSRLIINSYSCVAPFVQWAGIEALKGSQREAEVMREAFRERRDLIVKGLNAIQGIRCAMPPGAFYVFPNITAYGKSSRELADYLLEEAGVATLPGTDFGGGGEGYLRLSYANSPENIEKALERISTAVHRL
ncbi:MAG: pyridoxal phosphate-dependent aminotransferase [Anaerolineales bacterium]|jgi:aspartate/methionine/tyrosine aminotransferase